MDQEPQEHGEAASDSDGGKKGVFQNINTVIAGITGLVVALGGLVAAWDRIFPHDTNAQEVAALAEPAAATTDSGDPSDTTAAEPEEGDPLLYEGDGVTLEWTGDEWVLTDADGEYRYEEVYSPDETRIVAHDKANDAYLRWPVKGGMAEEGSEDKQTWTTYVEFHPAEGPSE